MLEIVEVTSEAYVWAYSHLIEPVDFQNYMYKVYLDGFTRQYDRSYHPS